MFRTLLTTLLLAASGCATVPPGPPPMRAGHYFFECPIYSKDKVLVELTHTPDRHLHVAILERYKGGFDLRPTGGGGLKITRADIPLADISRSLKGEGTASADGMTAKGTAVIWTPNLLGLSRDHRTGPWSLTPAPEETVRARLRRVERREEAREKLAGGLEENTP